MQLSEFNKSTDFDIMITVSKSCNIWCTFFQYMVHCIFNKMYNDYIRIYGIYYIIALICIFAQMQTIPEK